MQSEDFHQDIDTRDAILMGLDRVEHSIAPVEDVMYGKYAVGSPEMKELIELMLARNVYFDATMRAYGDGTIAASTTLKTRWVDEAQFFTPYMQSIMQKRADARRGPQPLPPGSLRDFAKLFKHKVPELKAFYDAGGGRLITVGTDMPTSGPDLAGFAYHRELQAIVYAGLPPAGCPQSRDHQRRTRVRCRRPAWFDRAREVGGSVRRQRQSPRADRGRPASAPRHEIGPDLRSTGAPQIGRGENWSLRRERSGGMGRPEGLRRRSFSREMFMGRIARRDFLKAAPAAAGVAAYVAAAKAGTPADADSQAKAAPKPADAGISGTAYTPVLGLPDTTETLFRSDDHRQLLEAKNHDQRGSHDSFRSSEAHRNGKRSRWQRAGSGHPCR